MECIGTKNIKSGLSRLGLDALLVTGEMDIRYLAGFYVERALILVKAKGGVVFFIDPMNYSLARKVLKNKEIKLVKASGHTLNSLAAFLKGTRIKKIGFDDKHMTVFWYGHLSKLMPGVKFISQLGKTPVSSVIAGAREIKTPAEIRVLRRAAKETIGIWEEIRRAVRYGMEERQIAAIVDAIVVDKGYVNSFPTIAAAGKNSAYPHAIPTGKRFEKGEHLLVDFGIRLDGYCSDLTRVIYKDRMNRKIRLFQDHVLKAQEIAVKEIKPGVAISQVAEKTNKYFNDNGLGGYILHSLGHGIGVEVHEAPAVSSASKGICREGMVFTVEPGLYKEGLGGIRQEDMVLVTKNGCEVLTL